MGHILSIDPTLQPENFKYLKYMFGSACGIFAVLTICWICNHISSHFLTKIAKTTITFY